MEPRRGIILMKPPTHPPPATRRTSFFATCRPLIKNFFYKIFLIITKESQIDFQNRKWNYFSNFQALGRYGKNVVKEALDLRPGSGKNFGYQACQWNRFSSHFTVSLIVINLSDFLIPSWQGLTSCWSWDRLRIWRSPVFHSFKKTLE